MNLQDPIDADRMRHDITNHGDIASSIEDATDPFLTALAVIGELAGMSTLHSIIDVLEDEVPDFHRSRVIEMNDDFAAHYAKWSAAHPLKAVS